MQFSEYVLRSVLAKADPISKGINEVYLQLVSRTHGTDKQRGGTSPIKYSRVPFSPHLLMDGV